MYVCVLSNKREKMVKRYLNIYVFAKKLQQQPFNVKVAREQTHQTDN